MYYFDSDGEDRDMGHDEAGPSFESRWEAIGPFPCGMREHPLYGSPSNAFPPSSGIDVDVDFARRRYDRYDSWPSELPNGGRVGWSTFHGEADGQLDISFPDVDWNQLRSDHGWAALQHQVLLRTRFHVPSSAANHDDNPIPFKMDLQQCVEYAFVPLDGEIGPVEWYQGDIYGFAETPSGSTKAGRTSNFARSMALQPGDYVLLVRAIYEIRLFGDPGDKAPTINLKIRVQRDDGNVQLLDGLSQVPNVVEGWLLGSWIAVAVRVPATGHDLEVQGTGATAGLMLESRGVTRIAAGQTRMVAMRISQSQPLKHDQTSIRVDLSHKDTETGQEAKLEWDVPLERKDRDEVFRITFASPLEPAHGPPTLVSYAMIVPPVLDERTDSATYDLPVTLLLHGAAVWPENDLFTANVPKNQAWTVCPMGRTEWGEDWRGGSMADAWAARQAFGLLMQDKIEVKVSDQTLLIGHSNGGQGAWHLAARYPDRIVGLIAAAGYTKTQDYVPYTENVSNHYADPALMGVLHASLTPYNNDLHLSNLVHIPVLALHGSVDGNVPPRHSRLQASIVDSWAAKSDRVKFVEVEGQDHWWPGMFETPEVKECIHELQRAPKRSWKEIREEGFTLTCGNPDECGGLAGIRITELVTPGRLARLDVNKYPRKAGDPDLRMRSTNVKRIEVVPLPGSSSIQVIQLDGRTVNGANTVSGDAHTYILTTTGWNLSVEAETKSTPGLRPFGPVLRILATSGPLVIVSGDTPKNMSIAKRVAHDLFVYHRIDVEIMSPDKAVERLKRASFGDGNIIALGGPTANAFARYASERNKTSRPLDLTEEGCIAIHGRRIRDKGAGLVALQPHPSNQSGLMLLVHGNDELGLELAARLIPLRTGVPIPDWAIVSPRTQWQGGGGLIGAGVWDGQWGWNEATSWIDRIPDPPLDDAAPLP